MDIGPAIYGGVVFTVFAYPLYVLVNSSIKGPKIARTGKHLHAYEQYKEAGRTEFAVEELRKARKVLPKRSKYDSVQVDLGIEWSRIEETLSKLEKELM